jgi:hypothetical protein
VIYFLRLLILERGNTMPQPMPPIGTPPVQPGGGLRGDITGTWRITLVFRSGNFGWTESYFSTNNSLISTLSAADTLARARAGLLGAGATIEWKRVSSTENWRDFGIVPYTPPLQPGFSQTLEYPTTALLLLLGAGGVAPGLYRGRVFLRAIPDPLVNGQVAGYYDPTQVPGWQGALNTFILALTSGSWGILAENRFAQTGNPEVQVMQTTQGTDAQGNPTNQVVMTLGSPAPTTWTTLGWVLLRGWRGVIRSLRGGPNRGPYQVASISTDRQTVTINDAQALVQYPVSLMARALVRSVQPINYVSAVRITERRTGRPLNLERGRAFPRRP